ncbi:MAG: gliding motility-associated C-terminal domain-containing protein [Bacteroidales bacterium]|nr:gliding motility-associated C-terminal domain-containing protein [Bacteroidales bacterium]
MKSNYTNILYARCTATVRLRRRCRAKERSTTSIPSRGLTGSRRSDVKKIIISIISCVLFFVLSVSAQNSTVSTYQETVIATAQMDICRSHLLPLDLNRIKIMFSPGVGEWYNSNDEKVSNVLVFGEDQAPGELAYYFKVKNYKSTCVEEENSRFNVIINIKDIGTPKGNPEQFFCYRPGELPTVSQLNAEGSYIYWYETLLGGEPLAPDHQLENGKTYYASERLIGCGESTERLEVNVQLGLTPDINITQPDIAYVDFDLEQLKIEDVNDTRGFLQYFFAKPENATDDENRLTDWELNINQSKQIYVMKVTEDGACYDVDSVFVKVEHDVQMPRGFSPNGDGVNDLFVIEGIEKFPDNELMVANRNGTIVYRAKNYRNDWDGKSRSNLTIGGGLLPEGTYFVVLKLSDKHKPIRDYIYIKH